MIRHLVCVCLVFSTVIGVASAKKWEIYQCELLDKKNFDGDSFWVKAHTGRQYKFRLYGVDCAETGNDFPKRNAEQAKDFKIAEKDVIKWGKKAKKFTEKFLRKPFTVYTQKIKAGGAGGKIRYYAIVVDADGKRLDEALVEAGLARVHGFHAEWKKPFWGGAKINLPRKSDKDDFQRRLKRLQIKARNDKVGVWKK